MTRWQLVAPEQRAPYITGCRETHVLADDGHGHQRFVPREWLQPAPTNPTGLSWAFKRDMLFLLFVALSCLGVPWNLPLALMGAVAVARWRAA